MATIQDDFLFHLRALSRLIYVVTDEEDRFLVKLRNTLSKAKSKAGVPYVDRCWVYSATFGLTPIKNLITDWTSKAHAVDRETLGFHDTMERIYKDDPKEERNFYVITDPERWLSDAHMTRRVLNVVHQVHNDIRTLKILIFVGTRKVIPEVLAPYVEVVHDPGMGPEDILETVDTACKHLEGIEPPANAVNIFKGLSSYQVDMSIAQSIVATKKDPRNPKRIDPTLIAGFKRRQLKKTDLVTYLDDLPIFDEIGGNERFKEWATETRAAWSEEGQKFGLKPPKGVLLVGIWGCGKSLASKAMAHAWGLPVVSLEMGRLRSANVGQSEQNVYRAIRIIEAAAPCVTGETQVTLANGTTKPIHSLWETYVSGSSEPLFVQCWNEKTYKVEITEVHAITRRKAEAFRIEAVNGFYLNATANHQHYVMRGGMPEWVRTDELLLGDMLAVPIVKHDGNADCFCFHPEGMRNLVLPDEKIELRRGGGGYRDAVVPKLPLMWSPVLGWLLGAIEGDGFIGINDGIGLTNTSTRMLDAFERILVNLFGLQAVRHLHENQEDVNLPGLSNDPVFKPCWTTVITNQLAAEFLRTARENILSAPPQVRAAFLAGWIDADGCIGPNRIGLSVKHPRMWDRRQLLARQLVQSLGVVPSKFDFPNMEITGSRAVTLASILGEYLIEKSAKAALVSSSEIGFDRGMGFACGQILHNARKTSGLTFAQLGMSSGTTWNYENGLVPVSERHMREYVAKLGKEAADLKRLLIADCRWVKITSIESCGVQDVYDLACKGENTHSFIANGLVTHNCVVWVDEAEKSFSGGQSSAQSDAGTTSRTIGILSTWLQETKSPVCLALTANGLDTLPIEFVNRMDERFFFDLPHDDERIEIIRIHLTKNGQKSDNYQLADLAEKAKGMVGREIEQAIQAAMRKSFAARKPRLDETILANILGSKPRILKTMVDEVRKLIEWVGFDPDANDGIKARLASAPRDGGSFKIIDVDG